MNRKRSQKYDPVTARLKDAGLKLKKGVYY